MLLLLPNTNSFQQFEDYDTVKPVMGTLKYGPIRLYTITRVMLLSTGTLKDSHIRQVVA